MKPWVKNVMRKQKQARRSRVDIEALAEAGELAITDPLQWSNLIAERVGYARYQANKKNEELDTEATHALMGAVIREVNHTGVSSVEEYRAAVRDRDEKDVLLLVEQGGGSRFVVIKTK